MKVVVKPKRWNPSGTHEVRLVHGVQSFTLDYFGSKKECQWYAKMFRIALKKHVEECK